VIPVPKSKLRKNRGSGVRGATRPMYLLTWVEVADDAYYTHLAHHRFVTSVEDANILYGEILARQNETNPAPELMSLPCPKIFVINGTAREVTDGEYDELFGCETQYVKGM
jgi:hypothetical protein